MFYFIADLDEYSSSRALQILHERQLDETVDTLTEVECSSEELGLIKWTLNSPFLGILHSLLCNLFSN